MSPKILLTTSLLLCACAGCKKNAPPVAPPEKESAATQPTPVLLPVVQDGRWGYIDLNGEMVVSPQFDRAGDFQRGFASVWVEGKLGYIDRDGRFLFPPAK